MTDWKGARVIITIYEQDTWTYPLYEKEVYLDSDTLPDLFARFNPMTHNYEMWPSYDYEAFADEEDDE